MVFAGDHSRACAFSFNILQVHASFPYSREKKNSTTQRGFSLPQPYHITPPSRKRDEKRDEWLDFRDVCSRCALLCAHLGGWFNSRSRPKKTRGTVEQFAASKQAHLM